MVQETQEHLETEILTDLIETLSPIEGIDREISIEGIDKEISITEQINHKDSILKEISGKIIVKALELEIEEEEEDE